MSETIRIHNMVKHTSVLGPGKRAAVWFQGCMRNCPGCMSPSSRPLDGGKTVSVEKVVAAILSIEAIEGVTISGGEPFLQIDSLFALIKSIKEKSDLSVIIYTGYTMDELRAMKNSKVNLILKNMTDILIDGEYVEKLNDGISLRGSSNQDVYFLSDRYKGYENIYTSKKRDAEIFVSNKDLFFVGIPEKETLKTWLDTTKVLNDEE